MSCSGQTMASSKPVLHLAAQLLWALLMAVQLLTLLMVAGLMVVQLSQLLLMAAARRLQCP
jgi:hypothetical protein